MIEVEIPGFGRLCLEHLVCDYNGRLAAQAEAARRYAESLTRVGALILFHRVVSQSSLLEPPILAESCKSTTLTSVQQELGALMRSPFSRNA